MSDTKTDRASRWSETGGAVGFGLGVIFYLVVGWTTGQWQATAICCCEFFLIGFPTAGYFVGWLLGKLVGNHTARDTAERDEAAKKCDTEPTA